MNSESIPYFELVSLTCAVTSPVQYGSCRLHELLVVFQILLSSIQQCLQFTS